jgi:four helix bundle protein
MSGENLVKRTKNFAIECVQAAEKLNGTDLARHIRGQLIRCSTSVAANYRATRLAQSKAAFVAKLSIVIEECDEAGFWLDFALEFNLFKEEEIRRIMKEANELTSIFVASRITAQGRRK